MGRCETRHNRPAPCPHVRQLQALTYFLNPTALSFYNPTTGAARGGGVGAILRAGAGDAHVRHRRHLRFRAVAGPPRPPRLPQLREHGDLHQLQPAQARATSLPLDR
eukprot:7413697-Pyramimonas_sp.AAC.2